MAKKTEKTRRKSKRSATEPAERMRLVGGRRPKSFDPIDCLCWLADWLIELVAGYPGCSTEDRVFAGPTLSCFAVKLGLVPNEPSQWPYRDGDWSESDPCPSFERPLSLREKDSRNRLISKFEELKTNAIAHGSWEDHNLQGTPTTEDFDRLKHCAYTIADRIGTTPPNHVYAGPESRALVEGLVRAGLLNPDWILLMRTGVLNFSLESLKTEPGRCPALAAIIEKVLFPEGEKKPPISEGLLGNLVVGDKSWVESMIEEIRKLQIYAQSTKSAPPRIEGRGPVPFTEIPPEERTRMASLSAHAARTGGDLSEYKLKQMMLSRTVTYYQQSREKVIFDKRTLPLPQLTLDAL